LHLQLSFVKVSEKQFMINYITKEGLKKLQEELEILKKEKRPNVIQRIATARELGDLSENGDYQDAKDEQGFIEGRIMELENLLNKSEIIQKNDGGKNIGLGSKITADCGGVRREITIVGVNESDPASGFISNESPMGMAFMGKRKGDKVEVDIPSGKMICEILKVEN